MKSIIFNFLLTSMLSLGLFSLVNAQKSYEAYTVGFYNLENLFDTNDDDDVRDTEFTPTGEKAWTDERYKKKLTNMAKIIEKLGKDVSAEGVSILGVSEIENLGVLEDLVKEPSISARDYKIIHYDSPDKRGIDVAMLYNPASFTPISSKPHELLIERDGKRKYTRDVLHVKGLLKGDTIHVLVNHWPSRSGGEKKSSPLRKAAAQLNKDISDSIFAVNPGSKILIMGDLNDDPTSPSVKKILNAKPKKEKVKNKGFYNPMYAKYQRGEGSNAYRDAWSLFDQIIVSKEFLDIKQKGLFFHKALIFKDGDMLQPSGQYKNYPFRTFSGSTFINGYSDHFPVVVYLLKEV